MSDAPPPTTLEVIARVRPLAATPSAARAAALEVVSVDADGATLLVGGARFTFTAAAPGGASQEAFFDLAGRRACDAALAGYNATLFAYGQTGSGKTHTIYGGAGEARGLLPRTLDYVFAAMRAAEERSGGRTAFTAKASFLEVRAGERGRRRGRARPHAPPPLPSPPPPPLCADLQ